MRSTAFSRFVCTLTLGAAGVLLVGCDGPERVAFPTDFPMHARIGDTVHHGGASICLPLDGFRACPVDMTFFPERMGVVPRGSATSVVIWGDIRVLPGAGLDDIVLRPGADPDASIIAIVPAGDDTETTVSDFELQLDGMTHSVSGSITSSVHDVFEFWGRDIWVSCPGVDQLELVTETGEVRPVQCDGEW